MEEWKQYKLGDVCSRLRSGKGIKAESVSNTGLYPVIGGNGVRGYTNESNFKGECAVIGRQGAYCGNVRFYDGEAYMTEHAVVVVGNELADTRFLACLLSLMHLGHLSAQSAQPGLSVQTLSKQLIYLPPVEYQRRVSSIIKSFDDKIDCNRRINDNLQYQAQALYKSWFVDFEPFKDGEFVDSELGMIPKGWRVKAIDSLVEISKKSVNPYKYPEVQFVHYSIPSYDNGKQPEKQFGQEILSNKFVLKDKMTLFSKLNPRIKRVWFVNDVVDNSICSTEFVPYMAQDNVLSAFVYCLISSQGFYDFVMSLVNGATGSHQRFHPEETLSYRQAFNSEVALRFSRLVEPMITQTLKNQQESRRLAQLRDTLLPRLMSGELKVSDID